MAIYFVWLLSLMLIQLIGVSVGDGVLNDTSCAAVAEVFAKRVPSADSVHVSLISDASLNECAGTLKHTHGASCCNADMESKFLHASADYLRQHVQSSNHPIRTRITNSLHLYQDHLRLSMEEAHNKTSDTLTNLYKIPKEIHHHIVNVFYHHLNEFLIGNTNHSIADIINDFFLKLFPTTFDYVLSDPSKPKSTSEEFRNCLLYHYNDIQPFGNIPKHLATKLKFGFRRARIFTETLKVMVATIDSTDSVLVDRDCQKALSRLHFCSLCSGEVDVKPCRGMCLNVMRGCLAGISEISSSWDELVVAFENLHLGMFKHNTAQELLLYLDGNITDALLHALDDGPRIYAKVTSLCQEHHQTEGKDPLYKKYFTTEAHQPSHPSSRIHSIRKDITSLISQLEDSKGFLQRMADGLCRTSAIYDQEMRSESCWNGTAIGKYMHPVPEANMISQAQQNREVRITLIPDTRLLQGKDKLTHMRRDLSTLHNEELMLKDESYKTVVGSGGGGYGTPGGRGDITDDDEDFAGGTSGSGSGDEAEGGYNGETGEGEKPSETTRPTGDGGKGQGSTGSWSPGGTHRPTGGHPGDNVNKPGTKGPKGSTATAISSPSLLLATICAVLPMLRSIL